MTQIKNLTIDNFRGFDHLEIKDFGRLNVFVGRNNSGKSSILESIFMLSGMSNPSLSLHTNSLRGLKHDKHNMLASAKYIFHNVDYANHPKFGADLKNDSSRKLEIVPVFEDIVLDETNSSNRLKENLVELDCRYSKGTKNNVSKLVQNDTEIQSIAASDDIIFATFLTASSRGNDIKKEYAELVKEGRADDVLEAVKLFDNKITALEVLPDAIYLGYESVEKLMPLQLAGDGLNRFLDIIVSALHAQVKVLLIDEIDNGLHYSAYQTLWRSLIEIAQRLDIQLFITTHSLETLQALERVLSTKGKQEQDDMAVYFIEKTSLKGFQSYRYSYGGLKGAIESEIEIRG